MGIFCNLLPFGLTSGQYFAIINTALFPIKSNEVNQKMEIFTNQVRLLLGLLSSGYEFGVCTSGENNILHFIANMEVIDDSQFILSVPANRLAAALRHIYYGKINMPNNEVSQAEQVLFTPQARKAIESHLLLPEYWDAHVFPDPIEVALHANSANFMRCLHAICEEVYAIDFEIDATRKGWEEILDYVLSEKPELLEHSNLNISLSIGQVVINFHGGGIPTIIEINGVTQGMGDANDIINAWWKENHRIDIT